MQAKIIETAIVHDENLRGGMILQRYRFPLSFEIRILTSYQQMAFIINAAGIRGTKTLAMHLKWKVASPYSI